MQQETLASMGKNMKDNLFCFLTEIIENGEKQYSYREHEKTITLLYEYDLQGQQIVISRKLNAPGVAEKESTHAISLNLLPSQLSVA